MITNVNTNVKNKYHHKTVKWIIHSVFQMQNHVTDDKRLASRRPHWPANQSLSIRHAIYAPKTRGAQWALSILVSKDVSWSKRIANRPPDDFDRTASSKGRQMVTVALSAAVVETRRGLSIAD